MTLCAAQDVILVRTKLMLKLRLREGRSALLFSTNLALQLRACPARPVICIKLIHSLDQAALRANAASRAPCDPVLTHARGIVKLRRWEPSTTFALQTYATGNLDARRAEPLVAGQVPRILLHSTTALAGMACLASQMKAMVIVSPKSRRIRDTPREDCAFINTWIWHATAARWQHLLLVQLEVSLLCLCCEQV